jgi:hypothetical protein
MDETATTLFCLIAGDDIHDTFERIADGGYPLPFMGRLYIYTFVTIFLTSVLNVFIFLIEDAYDAAKQVLPRMATWRWRVLTTSLAIGADSSRIAGACNDTNAQVTSEAFDCL